MALPVNRNVPRKFLHTSQFNTRYPMKFSSLIQASMLCVVIYIITAGSNTDGSAGSTGGTFSRLWGALETAGASLKEAGKATAEKVKRVGEAKIEKVKRVGEAKIEKVKAVALKAKTAVENPLKFVVDQLVVPAQQLVKYHKERLGAIVDALHEEAATGHALDTELQELKREGFVPLTDAQAVESCPDLPHNGHCLVDLKDCLNIRCPLAVAGVGSAFLGMHVNRENVNYTDSTSKIKSYTKYMRCVLAYLKKITDLLRHR